MSKAARYFYFIVVLLLLFSSSLYARELHWSKLEVHAHLNAAGDLQVTERQYMVFNGDWNGGERDFYLGFRQRLEFLGMDRIDPNSGSRIHLTKGDLSAVDQFKFVDRTTLRWRSRLPSDPLFNNQTLIYELHYRLGNILQRDGGAYLLDHDFAFAKREGVIQHFSLDLDFDPNWSSEQTQPIHLERGPLYPGKSVVLRISLRYTGAGLPPGQVVSSPLPLRLFLVAALLGFIIWRSITYVRHENANGKYEPLPDIESIDLGWLETHVLNELPEKIGSLWDAKTGAAEVAAILARMTQEGKLDSRVESRGIWPFRRPVLFMKLKVEVSRLKSYEASLVKALFFGHRETDTRSIRKHYKKTGFDPAKKIRRWLPDNEKISSANKKALRYAWVWTLLLFLFGTGLIIYNLVSELDLLLVLIPWAIALALIVTLQFVYFGHQLRLEVEHPVRLYIHGLLVYLLYAASLSLFIILDPLSLPITLLTGFILWAVMLYNNLINQSMTRVSPRTIARRKELCAARRYFKRELGKPEPAIRDEWFPYLIAFGLDTNMQRWFKHYGHSVSSTAYLGHSNTPSASGGSWTGGGGSFGGAGAAGSWSVAAGAVAAGVSTPSSSGSGGGGSSGGGGGGGW